LHHIYYPEDDLKLSSGVFRRYLILIRDSVLGRYCERLLIVTTDVYHSIRSLPGRISPVFK
jgi:hypothetical protein